MMFAPDTTLWICAFIILNVWTFMMFGFDKLRAEAGSWRISEQTLLFLALIGGSLGAFAGRSFFHHKTSKEPFSAYLVVIAILHLILGAAGIAYLLL